MKNLPTKIYLIIGDDCSCQEFQESNFDDLENVLWSPTQEFKFDAEYVLKTTVAELEAENERLNALNDDLIRVNQRLEIDNVKLKSANRWIPVSQLPTKRGHYWCYIVFEPSTFYDNSRETWQREAWFDGKKWHSKWGVQRIKAWREIPEPYQEAK